MQPESPSKSRKRRAAEEALEARFASRRAGGAATPSGTADPAAGDEKRRGRARASAYSERDGLRIPACRGCCDASCAWENRALWLPHIRLDEPWTPAAPPDCTTKGASTCTSRGGGGGASHGTAFGVCDVIVVDSEEGLAPALQRLRASMRDPVVGLDLEWRPDGGGAVAGGSSSNDVALMQLATSSLCLLIRTCRIGRRLPPALQKFLRDPAVTLVGFAWESADARKFLQTFKWRREDFGRFMDLKHTATSLGYPKSLGLAALARHVLGFQLPKGSMVSLSDWEAAALSPEQVQYAALDAFVTGHLVRCLGLWHSSPSPCPGCKAPLGLPVQLRPAELVCPEPSCRKVFSSPEAMRHHSIAKDHPRTVRPCAMCGRWNATATPASAVKDSPRPELACSRCSSIASVASSQTGIKVGA